MVKREITGDFGHATIFTEPGQGVRISIEDVLEIFGKVKGYRTNLNRQRKDSNICILEDAGELVEVITLSMLIESVVTTPEAERWRLYDMIMQIEDAVIA